MSSSSFCVNGSTSLAGMSFVDCSLASIIGCSTIVVSFSAVLKVPSQPDVFSGTSTMLAVCSALALPALLVFPELWAFGSVA